ncbi:MAG: VPLPA-CTERM sorting domain-containing protein [Geminicoccaceae bacterium]
MRMVVDLVRQRASGVLGAVAVCMALAAGVAAPARAALVSTSQSATYGIELSGVTPAGPYNQASLAFTATSFTNGEQARAELYDGSLKIGTVAFADCTSPFGSCSSATTVATLNPTISNTGFLLVVLSAVTGSFDVTNLTVKLTNTLSPPQTTGNLTLSQVVPLPAALPLLASGIVGLGWVRRRQRKVA